MASPEVAVERPGAAALLAGLTTLGLLVATVAGAAVPTQLAFRDLHVALAVLAAGLWLRGRPGPLPRPLLAAMLGAFLLWLEAAAATHYLGFRINGVDFSVYDWMLESTARGRPGYSPIYDVDHLAVHPSLTLLLLTPLHQLAGSPWLLVLVGPLLVWAGVFPALALARRLGLTDGLQTWAVATAYLANAWTGRLANTGARLESLVPLLCLLFLLGWLGGRPWRWAAAAVALLLTKEDAALYLGSFFALALLREAGRRREAAAGLLACGAWLALYLLAVRPALLGGAPLPYLSYWAGWGLTPGEAALGMVRQPLAVLEQLGTSGLWAFFAPVLFLPWASPRAAAAMLPTVLLLGTASNPELHGWASYYAIPVVPFALLGLLEVQAAARRRSRTLGLVAAAALLAFPLFQGGYARTVPWAPERLEGVAAVRARLAGERPVFAQTVVFPHLGYPRRLLPLFDLGRVPEEALLVVHPELDPWPFTRAQLEAALEGWRATRTVEDFPGGFALVSPR